MVCHAQLPLFLYSTSSQFHRRERIGCRCAEDSADDGVASDWHLNHLGMLANSGAALVVIEATGIDSGGRISHGCFGLYSDDCEAALARVVAHCRQAPRSLAFSSLYAGRKASAQRPWKAVRRWAATREW